MTTKPTRETLLSLLVYQPANGVFRWRSYRKWSKANRLDVAGHITGQGYLGITLNGSTIRLHRAAFFLVHGYWPPEVDHIDHNRANNAIKNLREADDSQNAYNAMRRKDNSSGFKGVSFDVGSGKYMARVRVGGKSVYLGRFPTAQEAGYVAAEARLRFHKEFAAD